MAVVLVMMAVITGLVHYSVREYMFKEAQERYTGILQTTFEEFRRRLSDVYVSAMNNVHDIERDIDKPDLMYDHVKRVVSLNKGVESSAILFLPDYYPGKQHYFVPLARRDAAGVAFIDNSDSVRGYHKSKWYMECMSGDSGRWIGTYYNKKTVPNSNQRIMLTTYGIPVHDRQGTPVGMFCLQMSLESMRRDFMSMMKEVNEKFEKGQRHQSYCFVIDHEGNYIMHPDERLTMKASFFEQTKETPDTLDDHVAARMMRGENGEAMMDVDGIRSWICYRTVKYANWTMVIVVPKEVIFLYGRMLNTIILLTMLLGLLAIYLICRHLIKEITNPVTTQKAAMERELRIAHGIQMAMLPNTLNAPSATSNDQLDLCGSLTPARDVGGDLYDYFLRDDCLFFCIGDVTGKGVPAALMMAVMRAMFRSEARRADSATDIVKILNRNLSEESSAGYFVTMFVGILDLTTGHLDYCNAGHEMPLVSGKPLSAKPNLPVGALPDWNYEGQETQLQPGDMLFLYTDGLSEAMNHDGKPFGRQRVLEIASSHANDGAEQMIQLLGEEVHRHVGEAEQSDDITLLVIRWKGQEVPMTLLEMQPTISEIDRLKPYMESVTQQAGLDSKESKRLRLAVEEAVVNVINYGQASTITLQSAVTDGQLLITIDDDGVPFDPTKGSATDLSLPPDQRPPGGLGIILLHEMTDGLEYQRSDGHNILTLKKTFKSI
jgi:sigma-B regulation protein RsbU (phosphoserine phosphatase)